MGENEEWKSLPEGKGFECENCNQFLVSSSSSSEEDLLAPPRPVRKLCWRTLASPSLPSEQENVQDPRQESRNLWEIEAGPLELLSDSDSSIATLSPPVTDALVPSAILYSLMEPSQAIIESPSPDDVLPPSVQKSQNAADSKIEVKDTMSFTCPSAADSPALAIPAFDWIMYGVGEESPISDFIPDVDFNLDDLIRALPNPFDLPAFLEFEASMRFPDMNWQDLPYDDDIQSLGVDAAAPTSTIVGQVHVEQTQQHQQQSPSSPPLQQHRLTMESPPLLYCDKCAYTVYSFVLLQRHKAEHHSDEDAKK